MLSLNFVMERFVSYPRHSITARASGDGLLPAILVLLDAVDSSKAVYSGRTVSLQNSQYRRSYPSEAGLQEWIVNLSTTRLITPSGLGESGFKPSSIDEKRPSIWLKMTSTAGR